MVRARRAAEADRGLAVIGAPDNICARGPDTVGDAAVGGGSGEGEGTEGGEVHEEALKEGAFGRG